MGPIFHYSHPLPYSLASSSHQQVECISPPLIWISIERSDNVIKPILVSGPRNPCVSPLVLLHFCHQQTQIAEPSQPALPRLGGPQPTHTPAKKHK